MSLYIIRVFEDSEILEYEYSCIEHAREHMRTEKAMCELTEYDHGTEYLIECQAERR